MAQFLLNFTIVDPILGFLFYILIGLFFSSFFVQFFVKKKSETNIYYYIVGIIGAYIGGGLRGSFIDLNEVSPNFLNPIDLILSILICILLLVVWKYMFMAKLYKSAS